MEEEGPQVRVKFVTKNESIRVTETPFAVPARLNRQGLSQVVNHLLNTDKPRPFDFLIDGVFLRSTLEKYMRQHMISEESVLTLEYVEAMPAPEPQQTASHPDWVSSVAAIDDLFVTGCYDGIVRVHDAQGECVASRKAHEGAIKAVSVQHHSQVADGNYLIGTCGKDQQAHVWQFNQSTKALEPLAALSGHLNSVDALALELQGTRALTGSWDNTVRVWQCLAEDEAGADEHQGGSRKKQKKANGAAKITFRHLEAEIVLVGHTSAVSGVAFHPQDQYKVVSASSDRTVRIWDLTTHQCVQTITGNRAITSLAVNQAGLVLTAHPDHCVRLWDPRASATGETMLQRTFQSHKQWVSAVTWRDDSNEHVFASSSYDGTVKVWDIRSSIPLHTVAAHKGKAFDVAWGTQPHSTSDNLMLLASGGEDKELKLYRL